MTEEKENIIQDSTETEEVNIDEAELDETQPDSDTEDIDTEPIDNLEQQDDEPEDDDESSDEESTGDIEVTIESVVESVLFASDEPLTASRLANIIEIDTKAVRENIKKLNQIYKAGNHAFRIEKIAGGYQMLTLTPYNNWLRKLLRSRDTGKLSAAALETLAIIAYKQPIIRADIENIRGVAAGDMIRNLMYKGLVKIVGRAEILGRPLLYGTTRKFLEVFGLNSLKDLPKIEELKQPPQ